MNVTTKTISERGDRNEITIERRQVLDESYTYNNVQESFFYFLRHDENDQKI